MSETRMVRYALVLLAFAGNALAAQRTESPELADLRMRADAAKARFDSAAILYRAATTRGGAPRDTARFVVAHIPVVVTPTVLSDVERDNVVDGVERALATLEERFGDGARRLVDSTPWLIRGQAGRTGPFRSVSLTTMRSSHFHALRRPVAARAVEDFAMFLAGQNVARVVPSLRSYVGSEVSFAAEERRWEISGRELALSYATPARRCHRGDITQCRRVLTPAEGGRALDMWLDATDYRTLVVTSRFLFAQDSVSIRSWHRCEAGADSACARLARRMNVVSPYSTNLRTTFVAHAFEVGAPGMPARIAADSTGDIIARLSRAAGMSEDSLIAGWQRRSVEALERAKVPAAPLVLTTAVWGLLLLGVATRKRPS